MSLDGSYLRSGNSQCLHSKCSDTFPSFCDTDNFTFIVVYLSAIFLTTLFWNRVRWFFFPLRCFIIFKAFFSCWSQSFALPGWEHGMNRESVLAVVNMFNPAGVSCTAVAACLNVQLHVYSLYSIPQFLKLLLWFIISLFRPLNPLNLLSVDSFYNIT